MFKVLLNNLTPDIINEIIPQDVPTNYNLRQHRKFSTRSITTVYYETESIVFFSSKNLGNIYEDLCRCYIYMFFSQRFCFYS